MSIVFYEMLGCGHCVKSKAALASQIEEGLVIVKSASEAPWAEGFPAFENIENGEKHLGAVSSYEELCKHLKQTVENFTHPSKNSWGIGVL